MRNVLVVISFLFAFHINPVTAQTSNSISAAKAVLKRLIGDRANKINIKNLAVKGNDTYEIEATNGKLTISGNSAIAICYAFNQYLKTACHSMTTWNGKNIHIPAKWPDCVKERVTSPYAYRYYLNVVTFGYTTAYWDCKRWEKEIDWMALHGINMPLATVASEAIAARVWKKLGLSDQEISEFFTGPAHLPWHRMGNIDKWDGPFPASWHQDQLKMQHLILNRMHELGIQPITPAFAGFVPEGFKKKHPELDVKRLQWGGFAPEYNAFVLAPNSPYFEKIGKLFIQEWEKEFGKNKYYLSDSFNEMEVPVPKNDTAARYKLLADYGESVYRSIHAGNPDAVWVTQGWTFGYDHTFWNKPNLKALLKNVPDDKMVIIDLANEFPQYVWHIEQTWKTHEGYYGKNWIYSYTPNFGGKTPYTGVLDLYASASTEALSSPYHKTLLGFGFAPEGIENNEIIYELLGDMAWTNKNIDLDKWIPAYCTAKYGACPDKMMTAWQQLRHTVYGSFSSYPRYVWQQVTPDTKRRGGITPGPEFYKAVKNFLDCSAQLKQSELYRYDAIEIVAEYLSIKADDYYKQALKADSVGDIQTKKIAGDKAIALLKDIDRLLASHPTDRLQPWVSYARLHSKNVAEQNYYEANAKRLITTWGGIENDYAARTWGGLIRDYYIPRIQLHLAGNDKQRPAWEEAWIKKPGISAIKPFADPLAEAKELVTQFGE
jgi:alpha-N-acetylglucosaminidase